MNPLRTGLIGLGVGALLSLPSLTGAQFYDFDLDLNPFGLEDDQQSMERQAEQLRRDREYRQRQLDRYEARQRQLQRDFGLDRESQERRAQHMWERFEAEDRVHAREACTFIDRNPAAQQRCYESLR